MVNSPDIDMSMPNGKWINKLNGKTITVFDSIIDGDDMLLKTDIGVISMNEFSKYYIRVSDEVYDMKGSVIESKPATLSDIKEQATQQSAQNKNEPSTQSTKRISLDEIHYESSSTPSTPAPNFQNELIEKVFEKIKINPEVELTIKCDNFPVKELQMIIELFDVKEKDITEYFIKHIIDKDEIYSLLEKYIHNTLQNDNQ